MSRLTIPLPNTGEVELRLNYARLFDKDAYLYKCARCQRRKVVSPGLRCQSEFSFNNHQGLNKPQGWCRACASDGKLNQDLDRPNMYTVTIEEAQMAIANGTRIPTTSVIPAAPAGELIDRDAIVYLGSGHERLFVSLRLVTALAIRSDGTSKLRLSGGGILDLTADDTSALERVMRDLVVNAPPPLSAQASADLATALEWVQERDARIGDLESQLEKTKALLERSLRRLEAIEELIVKEVRNG